MHGRVLLDICRVSRFHLVKSPLRLFGKWRQSSGGDDKKYLSAPFKQINQTCFCWFSRIPSAWGEILKVQKHDCFCQVISSSHQAKIRLQYCSSNSKIMRINWIWYVYCVDVCECNHYNLFFFFFTLICNTHLFFLIRSCAEGCHVSFCFWWVFSFSEFRHPLSKTLWEVWVSIRSLITALPLSKVIKLRLLQRVPLRDSHGC